MSSFFNKLFLSKLLLVVLFYPAVSHATLSPNVENPIEPLNLNESRIYQRPDRLTENVRIITEKEIEQYTAHNLAELLSYITGVNIDTRGRFGHSVTYSLHGANARHARIMIDGVDFNNQTSGQSALAEIPIGNVKQVEIIKGSVSSRWGSALGGVINVVTKDTGRTKTPKATYTTVISEHEHFRQMGDLQGGIGPFGYYAFGEFYEAKGMRDFDGVRSGSGQFKASYNPDDVHSVIASFGLIDSHQNEGIFPDNTTFEQNYDAKHGKVKWNYDPTDNAHFQISGKANYQNSETGGSKFKEHVWGIDSEAVFTLRESDTAVFGFDWSYEGLKSPTLPEPGTLSTAAIYANYTANFQLLTFSTGVRYDIHSEFKDQVSPNVGVVLDIPYLEGTTLHSSLSRGFNAPPLAWLFVETAVFTPNPDLKPERAWTWQIWIESRPTPRLWMKVGFYQSIVKDAITTVFTGAPLPVQYQNVNEFRHRGVEGEIRFMVVEGFEIFAGASGNRVVNQQTAVTFFNNGIARGALDMGAVYRTQKGFLASFIGTYQRNRAGLGEIETEILFDLKISQKFTLNDTTAYKAFLNVYNIFDSTFRIDSFYPHPGRYFEFGVTLLFG